MAGAQYRAAGQDGAGRKPGGTHLSWFPALLTPFVGRRGEVAEVGTLLGGTRLLTVIGAGGAGKTRLALEVAREAEAAAAYPDGVHVVELAAVGDAARLSATVAAALDLEIGAMLDPDAMLVQLADQLGERRLLLVLDNCEHLAQACARIVTTLLLRCPALSLLATSREVLGVGGETVWPIPPLSLPPADATTPDDLAGSDAAALLCGRIAAARPGFVPDAAGVPALAQICRRLDGIPLALELAAARARVLDVAEIASRLDDRFTLLCGGPRLAAPHHQTLRAAMDWSHDLLAPDEQAALRRLAIFPDSFDLAAAGTVIDGEPRAPGTRHRGTGAIDVIARLADKSLVTATSTGQATRYRLLETVREYALEHLAEAGETALARERHRAWFVGLAREWRARPGDPWWSGNAWSVRLSADEASFRAAVVDALEADDTEAALDLVAALWMFWLMSFRIEGIDLLERVVAASEGATAASRVTALYGLAYLLSYDEHADGGRAVMLMDAAVALDDTLHGDHSDWMAHHGRADFALRRGDLMVAQEAAQRALERAEVVGVPVGIAYCERLLGWVATAQGDHPLARRRFERSLNQGWHCDLSTAHAAAALAPLLERAGDTARALDLVDEALERARRSPLRLVEAMALVQACKVNALAGDVESATAHAGELLALLTRTGARAWVGDALDALTLVLDAAGQPAAAARLAGARDALREDRYEQGLPDLAAERSAVRVRCAHALGAEAWSDELAAGRALSARQALAFATHALCPQAKAVPQPPPAPVLAAGIPTAALVWAGESWEVGYGGRRAYLRDAKGLHDLAVLISRPLQDVHVLELASPDPRLAAAAARNAPVLDGTALAAYRRRLVYLDDEETSAATHDDPERLRRIDAERAALRMELRTATGIGGRRRDLGGAATERARKAVSARLRAATRRIGEAIPELGAHLDRSLVTGTSCRYAPREDIVWTLQRDPNGGT